MMNRKTANTNRKDLASGFMLAVIGIGFAAGSLHYSLGTAARPGPGYFPFGLGVILTLLGVLISASSLFKGGAKDPTDGAFPWRPLLCITGGLVFFAFALPRAGFMISFPILIIITCSARGNFRWSESIATAIALTLICLAVFVSGLQLNIPLWPG
jgi:Tripartite tricarboxylate transporter TctB family